LKASGHANDDLMAILSSEHDDLLKTLEQLQQLRHRGRSATEEEWAVYGAHLIEVYREHAEREHRWLFPLLEQPPRGAAARWDPRITKETTLNAMIKGFPELLGVLHTFHLDCRWFGTQTLEEAAWYHGLPVEDLLGALNQSIAARRARRVPSCGGGDSGKRVDVGCVRGLPRERN
jgi:iron-sulfur cluster repair protein YtfE (RIC family)